MFNWLRRKEQPKNEEQVQQQQERVEEGLQRTKRSWFRQIASVFEVDEVTEDIWEDLETLLIQADVGVDTTVEVLDRLKQRVTTERLRKPSAVYEALQAELVWVLEQPERALAKRNGSGSANVLEVEPHPYVLLVVGVNGVGK
ncbi:MAG TPA: signal recognition particle receptor subunit alpha, partial [Chloroflexia bacterium]|nr:signal recognition particle receptor subunit alpha [Chloroflexia bacterium]